jgi:hypothetical protein
VSRFYVTESGHTRSYKYAIAAPGGRHWYADNVVVGLIYIGVLLVWWLGWLAWMAGVLVYRLVRR